MRFAGRRDRGSGSILMVVPIVLVVLTGIVGVGLAQFAEARARASSAADLAALAGSARGLFGDECPEAARIAAKGRAELDECTRSDVDLVVRVSVEAPRFLQRLAKLAGKRAPRIEVESRAGPPLRDD